MPVAFVAGATGYTGGHVVRALRARGVRTIAHVRPGSPALERARRELGGLGAEVDTTPWQRAALAETLGRLAPDAVFALLGTTRARMRAEAEQGREATYESVDYGLTVLLLDACVDAGLKPRFVYLSAVGVGPDAKSAYYAARARAEERVRESPLPWTIVRPSFITGADRPERRTAERAAAALGDAALGVIGALGARRTRDHYRSISGAALGRVLADLAFDPEAAGRIVEAEDLPRSP